MEVVFLWHVEFGGSDAVHAESGIGCSVGVVSGDDDACPGRRVAGSVIARCNDNVAVGCTDDRGIGRSAKRGYYDFVTMTKGGVEEAVGRVAGDGEIVVLSDISDDERASVGLKLDYIDAAQSVLESRDYSSALAEGRIQRAVGVQPAEAIPAKAVASLGLINRTLNYDLMVGGDGQSLKNIVNALACNAGVEAEAERSLVCEGGVERAVGTEPK